MTVRMFRVGPTLVILGLIIWLASCIWVERAQRRYIKTLEETSAMQRDLLDQLIKYNETNEEIIAAQQRMLRNGAVLIGPDPKRPDRDKWEEIKP